MTDAQDAQGIPPALRVLRVSKQYPGTRALSDVSLEVHQGEIHALLGANGSGKSTLVKVLAGVVRADDGLIEVLGRRQDARSFLPSDAAQSGLRFVHQHSSTFDTMTVAENLAAGRGFETGRGSRIRWREVHARCRDVLDRFEIQASPEQELGSLGPASQMMVAIARALQDQETARTGILVLDEPTAALPAPQVAKLLSALRRYAAAGQTIIYVTHRLEEVLDLADRTTVLRDGRLIATESTGDLTHESLVELIVGRALEAAAGARAARAASPDAALEVEGLTGGPLRDVSFALPKGGIVGVAGLVGSGRSSLLRTIFGDLRPSAGSIRADGRPLKLRSPADAIKAGIAYVPEDRVREAAFPQLTTAENLSAAMVHKYWRGGLLRHRSERADARGLLERYGIPPEFESRPLATLSGGTQQKAVLARWIRENPRVLLLDDPTQGVDVGARVEIYGLLREVASSGGAVLVVSSDFDELPPLCDSVLVLQRGRLVAEVSGAELDGDSLHELAYSRKDALAHE